MKMKIAIQMNDISSLNFETDSSLILAQEAQNRGYELYYYQPKNLSLSDAEIYANVCKIKLSRDKDNYYEFLSPSFKVLLKEMDVILIRQDPPFDEHYFTNCYLLNHIAKDCLIVNNPMGIINCPEKLFITKFKQYTPISLVTRDINSIREFRSIHQDIVVKPLYSYGGRDVFRIKPDDENFETILASLDNHYKCELIIQKFIPEVLEGEKRIFILDGKPICAILKIPKKGEIRSNLSTGSSLSAYQLTENDIKICSIIGKELKEQSILFAGIDMIGNYISEVNITSPSCITASNKLNNIILEKLIWDEIEKKLSH